MNLSECLTYADIEQLHRMARAYDVRCDTNSKNDLIQSLLMTVKHRDRIQTELDRLSEAEFRFLLMLMLDPRLSFSLEDLYAKAKMAYPKETEKSVYRKCVRDAVKRGWVFHGLQTHDASYCHVPLDFQTDIRRGFKKMFLKQLHVLEQEPEVYRDEGTALANDLRVFIHYIGEQEPLVTRNGVIYRRNQKQLLDSFAVTETLVGSEGWRFGYGRFFKAYPDRLSLLYDYAFYKGYIEEEPDRIRMTWSGEVWLERSGNETEILSDLIKFWMRLYKRPVPLIPFLVQWVHLLAEQHWVEEQSFVRLASPWIQPFYFDDEEEIIRRRLLNMMVHLGILQQAESASKFYYRNAPAANKLLAKAGGFSDKAIHID